MHPSSPPSGESTPESPLSGHHQPAAAAEGVSPEGPKRSGGRAKHVDSPGAEATQLFDSTHKFSGRPDFSNYGKYLRGSSVGERLCANHFGADRFYEGAAKPGGLATLFGNGGA